MRLHVGAGSVYLRDYTNVDLPLPDVYLAKDRPDLVERFITDEPNYYGRHADKTSDSLRGGAVTKETCCDVYGSFAFLPAKPGSVEEILSRQVFEHLSRHEAVAALSECARVLAPGGLLRLDIPDPDETIRQYRQTGDEFLLRHLFGPRRNEFGFHTHYNRETFRQTVESHGFTFESEEPNIHFYPSISMRFRRR